MIRSVRHLFFDGMHRSQATIVVCVLDQTASWVDDLIWGNRDLGFWVLLCWDSALPACTLGFSSGGRQGEVCFAWLRKDSPSFCRCVCLRNLISGFSHACVTLLHRRNVLDAPSSSTQMSNSAYDTYRSPQIPLPYDERRCSLVQHDSLKGSSHCHVESAGIGSGHDGSKLSVVFGGLPYVCVSSDDEDICPTCLEEYNPENPKMTLQCSHHFHLACIYEWMERSEVCPICGKFYLMLFEVLFVLGDTMAPRSQKFTCHWPYSTRKW